MYSEALVAENAFLPALVIGQQNPTCCALVFVVILELSMVFDAGRGILEVAAVVVPDLKFPLTCISSPTILYHTEMLEQVPKEVSGVKPESNVVAPTLPEVTHVGAEVPPLLCSNCPAVPLASLVPVPLVPP
jgi:hypothetical protein